MPSLLSSAQIRQALELPGFDWAAARRVMAPVPRGWQKRGDPPRRAAVLMLLYAAADSRLSLALTRRNQQLRGHSGQVSFPGGRQDRDDISLTATALRETCEEIGVCGSRIRILGALPHLYIPASNFDVKPIVARLDGRALFRPNPAEVAQVFGFALEDLLHPAFKTSEVRSIRGHDVYVPYYAVGKHKVWGATAILLAELEGRLRHVLCQEAAPGMG